MPGDPLMHRTYDVGRELLKWAALATMTLDHVGAVLYPECLTCRYIGRLSFPLFAYLLILGLETTRSVKHYFARIFLFAWISQVPFSLAMGVAPWDWLNIFFTLSAGVLFIELHKKGNYLWLLLLVAAEVLHFDFGLYGLLAIGCFYFLRSNRIVGVIAFVTLNLVYIPVSSHQLLALLALPPILLHDSGRFHMEEIGQKLDYSRWKKYFFYVYYPLHLVVLFSMKAGL